MPSSYIHKHRTRFWKRRKRRKTARYYLLVFSFYSSAIIYCCVLSCLLSNLTGERHLASVALTFHLLKYPNIVHTSCHFQSAFHCFFYPGICFCRSLHQMWLVPHAVYDLCSLSKLKPVHTCGQVSIYSSFSFVMVASESLNACLTGVFHGY